MKVFIVLYVCLGRGDVGHGPQQWGESLIGHPDQQAGHGVHSVG